MPNINTFTFYLKILLLFFLLLVLQKTVCSQTFCTFKVLDSITKKPIYPANIIYSNHLNRTIGFSTTEKNGSFKYPLFDSNQTIKNITIKAFGFNSLQVIVSNNILPCNEVFYLYEVRKSEEIKVMAQNTKTFKPDTTTFNASAYKLGSEQNVENLLEKLPLVNIDANGNVSFKGKSLDLISIEGDDLLGSRYQDYTKNVSANGIQTFEFIENYIDSIDRINGINNKKTNLNIIYKKTKRLFTNINLAASQNLKNSQGNADIIKLGKQIKSISFLNANNIGLASNNSINNADNLFAITTTHFLKPYHYDPNNQIGIIENYKIPQEKLQLNTSLIGSVNIFKKRKSNAVFRQNFQFQKDNFKQQYDEQTNFNIGTNNLPSFNMKTNRILNGLSFTSNTKIEKFIKTTWKNVKNLKLLFNIQNNLIDAIFQFTPILQNVNKKNTTITYTQQFINVKKSPKIKGHYFEANYLSNNGFYIIDSFSFFPTLFSSYINSSQKAKSNTLQLNYELQYSIKIFKKKVNSFVTINHYNSQLNTTFGDYINNKIFPNSFGINIQTGKISTFFISSNNSTNISLNKRSSLIVALNGLIGYNFKINSKLITAILPNITFNTILLNKYNLTSSFIRLPLLPSFLQASNLNLITGLNSSHIGNSGYAISFSNKASLNFTWTKMGSEIKYQINMLTLNININKNPYLSKFSAINQLIVSIDTNLVNLNNNFQTNFYKNINTKNSSFSFNQSINGIKNNYINNNGLAYNFNISNISTISWKYTLPKKVFFELITEYNISFNANKLALNEFNKVFNNFSFKQKAEKKFGKKLNIQIANEYYYFKAFSNKTQRLNFIDAKASYVISKKGASIAIQGRNITNVNTLIEQINIGISNQTNTYFLFPRLFLLRANFPL